MRVYPSYMQNKWFTKNRALKGCLIVQGIYVAIGTISHLKKHAKPAELMKVLPVHQPWRMYHPIRSFMCHMRFLWYCFFLCLRPLFGFFHHLSLFCLIFLIFGDFCLFLYIIGCFLIRDCALLLGHA